MKSATNQTNPVDAHCGRTTRRSADFQSAVSQGFQPARRAQPRTRFVWPTPCRLEIGDTADWKSALRGRCSVAARPGNGIRGFQTTVPVAERSSVAERRLNGGAINVQASLHGARLIGARSRGLAARRDAPNNSSRGCCGLKAALRVGILELLLTTSVSALSADLPLSPSQPNIIEFSPQSARFIRFAIHESAAAEPCIDELEVYGPDSARNLALATSGAKASASSFLPGYAIHRVAHLNDGHYGNGHSWIAAGAGSEWAQIELPQPAAISRVVFSRDREGRYQDRMPTAFEVRVSLDGQEWKTVSKVGTGLSLSAAATWDDLLRYAFLREQESWSTIDPTDPVTRVLKQFEAMIERSAAKGLDVSAERAELAKLRQRQAALATTADAATAEAAYLEARLAKRRLFLRDPDLAPLARVLFVKRHPYEPSHNYSDILDAKWRPGGGVCVLEIPRRAGRFEPGEATVTTLFDAKDGVARDAMPSFDARQVYFAYRNSPDGYFHLFAVDLARALHGANASADGLPAAREPVGGPTGFGLRQSSAAFDGSRANEKRQRTAAVQDASAPAASVSAVRSSTSQLRSPFRQLTEGTFHDYYPCPLPDGGLAFISTRCKARFLCWRPQAFVLFRMDADGGNVWPLSYANISEWAPSVMRDGRILWTRSEYIDKGADFGHTLWAIRPDGTHPELVFGNNTRNCYMNGREVPGTGELCATLISHGGDLNGPIALIEPSKGRFNPEAITNITPDSPPHYNMNWAQRQCFRDPVPIARDYFLVSHAPQKHFGLYVIDRWGNRELLHIDPAISSMCPSPLQPVAPPPALASVASTQVSREAGVGSDGDARVRLVADDRSDAAFPLTPALSPGESEKRSRRSGESKRIGSSRALPAGLPLPEGEGRGEGEGTQRTSAASTTHGDHGEFLLADIYEGLAPAVKRGTIKYLRVCQEVRADLERLPNGEYRRDHPPFEDFYASPTHLVRGPNGWPTYVAKAALGLVPVEEDGSARFHAPAGKVLYFQALDEDLNEVQRMRSVVQLQPGERRSCVGCHEHRAAAAPVRPTLAMRQPARQIEAPPWGEQPFAYGQVVQPVWDAKCVSCHDASDKQKLDLTGALAADRVPASYRTLITQGWVHYFDMTWSLSHHKAEPLTFGTVKSRLWQVLDRGHYDVQLTRDEMHRVKCWIDLNCPLWPDYLERKLRPGPSLAAKPE